MNWYKIAITKKEFYEFYALQGLDNKTLQDNPDFLYDLIERTNYIQAYYCRYLMSGIASELDHGRTIEPLRDNGAIFYSDQVARKLRDLLENFDSTNMMENQKSIPHLNRFLDLAQRYFLEASFDPYYGGKPWAEIAQWTKKLLNYKSISYGSLNFDNLRKFVMVIDVIHSLEHNTSLALNKLPNKEYFWLSAALEVVKNVKNPVLLADLSNNNKLSALYRREVLPLSNTREEVSEGIRDYNEIMAPGFDYSSYGYHKINERQRDYIQTTDNLMSLSMAINSHLDMYMKPIMKNPFIYTDDKVFQQLLDNAQKIDGMEILDSIISDLFYAFTNILEDIHICDTAFNYLSYIARDSDLYFLSFLSQNKKLTQKQADQIFNISLIISPNHFSDDKYELIYDNILNKLSPDIKQKVLDQYK